MAKIDLKNRATRACFKLKRNLSDCFNPLVALKLFKQVIKPICLYGCEVWGRIDSRQNIFKIFENLPAENLFKSFGRFVLGVHRKSSNVALRGELGILPLYIDILLAMLKYLDRLQQYDNGSILGSAYLTSVGLDSRGKTSWFSTIRNLTTLCDLNLEENGADKLISRLKEIFWATCCQ